MAEKRVRVPRAKFIETWETVVNEMKNGTLTGSGVQIVADRLGVQSNTVEQRATKFRRVYGVALSKMPRNGGAKFNVTAANAELEAIRAKFAQPETSDNSNTASDNPETKEVE